MAIGEKYVPIIGNKRVMEITKKRDDRNKKNKNPGQNQSGKF
jgi:hypothetical protein